MQKLTRRQRKAKQAAQERAQRNGPKPVEFACCGACNHLIKVFRGEDGPHKPCPRCGWDRHRIGGSWNWRHLAGYA